MKRSKIVFLLLALFTGSSSCACPSSDCYVPKTGTNVRHFNYHTYSMQNRWHDYTYLIDNQSHYQSINSRSIIVISYPILSMHA
jgi:hypothetical protein